MGVTPRWAPHSPSVVPWASVGKSSLTPLGNFCGFRQKLTFQRICGRKGRGKKIAKEHVAVDKPGDGHTPSTQRTALVRGAGWLPSTPLTGHLSHDFPCWYWWMHIQNLQLSLKNVHLPSEHFQVHILLHAAPLGQQSSTVQLVCFP